MPAGQAKLPWQLQEECRQSVADGSTDRERRADGNPNPKALTTRLTGRLFVRVGVKNRDVLRPSFPLLRFEDS